MLVANLIINVSPNPMNYLTSDNPQNIERETYDYTSKLYDALW